jgi:putative FmdB family regulatory protein
MPIYEYQCESCGEPTELLQKHDAAPATQCPHCHEHKLKKLFSAASFHLKGTGWYVTDFKDKPKDAAQKTQDKPTKTVDNKNSGETKAKDSKPDAKKTEKPKPQSD